MNIQKEKFKRKKLAWFVDYVAPGAWTNIYKSTFQFLTCMVRSISIDGAFKTSRTFLTIMINNYKVLMQGKLLRSHILCVHIITSSLWEECINKNRCTSVTLLSEEVKSIKGDGWVGTFHVGGGAFLHFWFKSYNLFGCTLN